MTEIRAATERNEIAGCCSDCKIFLICANRAAINYRCHRELIRLIPFRVSDCILRTLNPPTYSRRFKNKHDLSAPQPCSRTDPETFVRH